MLLLYSTSRAWAGTSYLILSLFLVSFLLLGFANREHLPLSQWKKSRRKFGSFPLSPVLEMPVHLRWIFNWICDHVNGVDLTSYFFVFRYQNFPILTTYCIHEPFPRRSSTSVRPLALSTRTIPSLTFPEFACSFR